MASWRRAGVAAACVAVAGDAAVRRVEAHGENRKIMAYRAISKACSAYRGGKAPCISRRVALTALAYGEVELLA